MKALIRKILPSNLWQKVQQARAVFDIFLAKLCVKSRLTSSLFYFLFSGQFHREHQSVLAGRLAYLKSLKDINYTSTLLRRNIHRLEKGLIMEPRKATFAEGYIQETVDIYTQCVNETTYSGHELKWAHDVLEAYFSVVSDIQVIASAKADFKQAVTQASAKTSIKGNGVSARPYSSESRRLSSMTSDELDCLFKQRRSVRWFENKPVPLSMIEKALDMALQAPSACNRQPFEFYTCIEPSIAAEIAGIPTGTNGFSENVQALIVIMGDLSAYPFERDRHVIYIDSGLVAMQLMLAFESLGLSTCPINWPDIESYEAKLAQRLSLPKHKRPVMMMAVGYAKPSGGIPFSQKKRAAQLIKVVD